MSNADITLRPAYLSDDGPEGAFAASHGFVQPPRIAMTSQRFNVLDENGGALQQPSLDLQVILLWENDTRILQPAYDETAESHEPPICFSDNRVTPSNGALQPQSPTCALCEKAVRNIPSFTNPKVKVAACKDRYKVACLVAGQGQKVFLLTIGPGSRGAYASYQNFLKSHHAKPWSVITQLGYERNQHSFSFIGWVSESVSRSVNTILRSDEPAMLVNAYDQPVQISLPAPAPKPDVERIATAAVAQAVAPTQSFEMPEQAVIDPPKRRGRPPKNETVVDPGPIASAAFAAPSTPAPSPPAPTANGGFGMATPQALSAELAERMNKAFG